MWFVCSVVRLVMPPHRCSERCRTLNRDGTIVCCVTGRTYGQYVTVDPWNRSEQLLVHRPSSTKVKAIRVPRSKLRRVSRNPLRATVQRLLPKMQGEVLEAVVREVTMVVEFVFRSISTRQMPLVLGALYLMRGGVHYPKLHVPDHPMVRCGLPCLSRLGDYGLKRASVRVGQNCIERCARIWRQNDP